VRRVRSWVDTGDVTACRTPTAVIRALLVASHPMFDSSCTPTLMSTSYAVGLPSSQSSQSLDLDAVFVPGLGDPCSTAASI